MGFDLSSWLPKDGREGGQRVRPDVQREEALLG
jgi:hypothetical protein